MRKVLHGRMGHLLWALAASGVAALITPPSSLADGGMGGGDGSQARVSVSKFSVVSDGPGTWLLKAHLLNETTGSNLTGMEVLASGTGPEGAVLPQNMRFNELGQGSYQAEFSGPTGGWSVTLTVREVPGNYVKVLPYSRTFSLTAQAGSSNEVAAGTSGGTKGKKNGRGRGGLIALALGIAGVGGVGVVGIRVVRKG